MNKIKIRLLYFLIFFMPAGVLMAHVQLDYPTGGEIFEAGESVSLHWHILIEHNQENWDLYFSSRPARASFSRYSLGVKFLTDSGIGNSGR